MSIKSFVVRNVATVGPDSTLEEAAHMMRECHTGTVIVTRFENGRKIPLGIVTDRDIVVSVLAKSESPGRILSRDVMSRKLVTLKETSGVFDAIRAMEKNGVRRLPVVDDVSGELMGVISADDLFEVLSQELVSLSKLSDRQLRAEKELRP